MKTKFILLAILLSASVTYSQFGSLVQSTPVTIVRSSANTAASLHTYVQNDIVRDTTTNGRLTPITVSAVKGAVGMVYGIMLSTDTAYASGINMKVLLYKDSLGIGKYIPADNAAYQTLSAIDTSFVGEIPITVGAYGTTAGGATGSRGFSFYQNIPFKLKSNDTRLWAVLLCDGSNTLKVGGKFTLYTWILR